MLTKLERNKIYDAIAGSGLDPAEFKLTVTSAKTVISHVSGSTFEFAYKPGNAREAFSSAVRGEIGTVRGRYISIESVVIDGSQEIRDAAPNISDLMIDIREWADEIRLVLETPDLWAETQRSRDFAINIQQADAGNTPFTNDERRRIVVELEAIKEQVKEQFDLTSEQIAGIDQWKDEVAEASERIGRKDWRLLAYGTIINLVVTDALPPEVARHILAMFIQVIAHLFLGGGGPPRILA